MSFALLFHYLLLDMFRMKYIHLQKLATNCGFISCVVLLWFGVCWCYGVIRLEWCGIRMQASACNRILLLSIITSYYYYYLLLLSPPQPNHTVTPTHIEPEQHNPWNKCTISLNLLKMDVLTFETCWAVNSEIIKQMTSNWSIFIQLVICYLIVFKTWSEI